MSAPTAHIWLPPVLHSDSIWSPELLHELEKTVLPWFLPTCRWFGSKGRKISEIHTVHDIVIASAHIHLLMIEVTFREGPTERYLLPLAIVSSNQTRELSADDTFRPIATFVDGQSLCDAFCLSEFRSELFQLMVEGKRLHGNHGQQLVGSSIATLDEDTKQAALQQSRMVSLEQSNTSVIYADRFFMKFFRKYESGIHPDHEVTSVLGGTGSFAHTPVYVGGLILHEKEVSGAVCMASHFASHDGTGWDYVLHQASTFADHILAIQPSPGAFKIEDLLQPNFRVRLKQLGFITAELHVTLAQAGEIHNDFAPEPFDLDYQRSLEQGMLQSACQVFHQLTLQLDKMDAPTRSMAERILAGRDRICECFAEICERPIEATRTRIHGDYHLGQLLHTEDDFLVIDFEGEPSLSLEERRSKRSVMKDVADMLRSFHYAAATQLKNAAGAHASILTPWFDEWVRWCSQQFLSAYYQRADDASILPCNESDREVLLKVFILDKALYEIAYEINYRPDWAMIPLSAVIQLLDENDENHP